MAIAGTTALGSHNRYNSFKSLCGIWISGVIGWNLSLPIFKWDEGTWINGRDSVLHDDIIKWEHFPRYWPFVRGIRRSPVNSPHKDQWRGALMFSFISALINAWVNNREAGDSRLHRDHYAVIVMISSNNQQTYWNRILYFDEIFITGCSGSCYFDNFRYSQLWKFRQNDIFVSMHVQYSKQTYVTAWKRFLHYWPFVWGILHRSPEYSKN